MIVPRPCQFMLLETQRGEVFINMYDMYEIIYVHAMGPDRE